jgi:hypothetical protein
MADFIFGATTVIAVEFILLILFCILGGNKNG